MENTSPLSLEDVCNRLGFLPEAIVQLARVAPNYYQKFDRKKRAGGTRTISASQGKLKWAQRAFLDGVLGTFEMPAHVQGCVKGRSAVTNAEMHVNRDVVINIDLSDFFGSVSLHMVTQLLVDTFNFGEDAAEVFAALCINDGVLPQGAPTSPTLANLVALKLDDTILTVIRSTLPNAEFSYSRYVDDITISGGTELVELLAVFYQCIEKTGFIPNIRKTKILRRNSRQTVTGLVVNKKATVRKKILRKLRQHIYYCQRWGLNEHCETLGISQNEFLKQIKGMLGYIATVRPDLALDLSVSLSASARDVELTAEEINLKLLKQMIDNEQVCSFKYPTEEWGKRIECIAAAVSLSVDPEGQLMLRAFQLQPEQGWKYFVVADMDKLIPLPASPI